jgi:glyoxylate utilization-related uncharacterized protein
MLQNESDGLVEKIYIAMVGNAVIAMRRESWEHHSEVFYVLRGEITATFHDGETVEIDEGGALTVHYGSEDADAEIYFTNFSVESNVVIIRARIFHNV